MFPVLRSITFAVLAASAAPALASAQDSTMAERRDAAMLLDHTFNSPAGEPVHVFLAKGVNYRAEITGKGLELQLRPIMASTQGPLIQSVLGARSGSASGESLYSILPRADAEYIFTTVGGTPGMLVQLRVYAVPKKDKPKP